jgi:transcriptional regulator with XRE-family HTH domain
MGGISMSNIEGSFWEELTTRLKKYRDRYGYTQQDVADHLGVGKSTYTQYEIGSRRIPVDMLVRVAALYNVSMDEMLGNSVQPVASTNIIHGNFTKEQLQKIQKYADLVGDDQL